jgi:hypothetical protein
MKLKLFFVLSILFICSMALATSDVIRFYDVTGQQRSVEFINTQGLMYDTGSQTFVTNPSFNPNHRTTVANEDPNKPGTYIVMPPANLGAGSFDVIPFDHNAITFDTNSLMLPGLVWNWDGTHEVTNYQLYNYNPSPAQTTTSMNLTPGEEVNIQNKAANAVLLYPNNKLATDSNGYAPVDYNSIFINSIQSAVPTSSQNATAIWGSSTRTLTDVNTVMAAYGAPTLNQLPTIPQIAAAVEYAVVNDPCFVAISQWMAAVQIGGSRYSGP